MRFSEARGYARTSPRRALVSGTSRWNSVDARYNSASASLTRSNSIRLAPWTMPVLSPSERCRRSGRCTGWGRSKLSTDPALVAKVHDLVVLSVDPPAQIQALERTQPGLPMKSGRAGTMNHNHHGTTTLSAASDARRVPIPTRPPGDHQPVHRRAHPDAQSVGLARKLRNIHRCRNRKLPSDGIS